MCEPPKYTPKRPDEFWLARLLRSPWLALAPVILVVILFAHAALRGRFS